VKENNSIPEPEIFTSEIEDTIDDLFKPSKEIEIDPLTQEVKEVAREQKQDDFPVEFELETEKEADVRMEEVTKPAPDSEIQDAKAEEDTLLELDLELEVEDQETQEQEQQEEVVAQEPEAVAQEADQKPGIKEKLEQLKQQIFTIEWEVTEPQIHQTLSLLTSLLRSPKIGGQPKARSMMELMKKVLQNIQYYPEKVPATAPSVLKRTTEFLLNLHSGKEVSSETEESIINELTALIRRPEDTEAESGEKFLILEEVEEETEETKVEDQAGQIRPEPEPTKEMPPAAQTVETQNEASSGTEGLSTEGLRILKAHLVEIKKCINRIEPLENLLSKTPGMEKLYSFQRDIRLRLERQLEEVSGFFFDGAELHLPTAVQAKKDSEEYARDMNLATCPWKELLTINIDGMEIGFPPEEVVFMSTPPWHAKSAIRKADALPLSKLKAWPWSKLKGLFSGRLADLEESAIASKTVPIVRKLGGRDLPVASNYTVIILFDGNKGAAILAEEKPLKIEISRDAKWTDNPADGFEAEVTSHGNKIMVATVNSLNQE